MNRGVARGVNVRTVIVQYSTIQPRWRHHDQKVQLIEQRVRSAFITSKGSSTIGSHDSTYAPQHTLSTHASFDAQMLSLIHI